MEMPISLMYIVSHSQGMDVTCIQFNVVLRWHTTNADVRSINKRHNSHWSSIVNRWFHFPILCRKCFMNGMLLSAVFPLQNPTTGVLRQRQCPRMVNRNLVQWAKVWGIMPKVTWHRSGDNSVTNDHFRAPGACLSRIWGSTHADCLIPFLMRSTWTTRKLKKKWWKPPKETL